jgi:Sigma-70, region 4
MPTERLSMRKVREVLRLKHAVGLSYREISEATGVAKTAVWEYIRRGEVIRRGVTLLLLWQEYRSRDQNGYDGHPPPGSADQIPWSQNRCSRPSWLVWVQARRASARRVRRTRRRSSVSERFLAWSARQTALSAKT